MTYKKNLTIKNFKNLIVGTLVLLMLSACNDQPQAMEQSASAAKKATQTTKTAGLKEPNDLNKDPNPMVILKTNLGDIELELDAEKAPLSVDNFLGYVEKGHYDGTIFHRVIPGFMIQGGGFASGMSQKSTEAPILNEANNGLLNDQFTIAMARTSEPHSATSQFFINVNNNAALNFTSETGGGWGYAVFGKVVNGQEVVKNIEVVATGRVGPHGDVPMQDVVIESAVISD